jgi:hypothetical protein
MNSLEIIPRTLLIQIQEYSRNIPFPFSFYSYDYKIQTPPSTSSLEHGSYSIKLQNTLVSYSAYNFPIQTVSDNSFATIPTNSELYYTKPHVPSYKYTQLPSPSSHTQLPEPRQTPTQSVTPLYRLHV